MHKVTRTVNGHSMAFATFLDVNGYFFDTTHFPNVFDQFPFTGKGCYKLEGKIVEEFGFPSIEVTGMKKLVFMER